MLRGIVENIDKKFIRHQEERKVKINEILREKRKLWQVDIETLNKRFKEM
jgi:hypothetical protein